jgi:hypothetical protein
MSANVEFNPADWPSADVWRTASRREQDSDFVFLAENKSDLEIGEYGAELDELVKELKASGVNANFAHEPEARRWHERKGHGEVSIIISAVGETDWDSMKLTISKLFPSDQLQVFIKSRNKDGLQAKVRMRGRGADVAEALSQVQESLQQQTRPAPGPETTWGSS